MLDAYLSNLLNEARRIINEWWEDYNSNAPMLLSGIKQRMNFLVTLKVSTFEWY